jgi:hypothetical protein
MAIPERVFQFVSSERPRLPPAGFWYRLDNTPEVINGKTRTTKDH